MARVSRLVIPGLPHHVTQRGVRSIDIFEGEDDRVLYLRLMKKHAERVGMRFVSWCLMTNHVHLIVVPEREDSLARGIGEAHRFYTRARNFREGVRGTLFQGRFGSCVLDEPHLLAAARYVELNPVAAGLVKDPARYAWSSAGFHLHRKKADPLVGDGALSGLIDDWRAFLQDGIDEMEARELEKHVSTGRPWGSDDFVSALEEKTGRLLRPRKRGWRKGRRRK